VRRGDARGAGDKLAIALDCGPGWTVPDAIRFGKAIEPYEILWIEDLITATTPMHTGEQVYLCNNFRERVSFRRG